VHGPVWVALRRKGNSFRQLRSRGDHTVQVVEAACRQLGSFTAERNSYMTASTAPPQQGKKRG